MPSRTPYTDILHTSGVLITRHPLPEGDEHPFDRPFGTPIVRAGTSSTSGNQVHAENEDEFDLDIDDENGIDREVLMPVEEIDNVLYLNKDDIADSDESQEWQVEQTNRGVNAV